MAPAAGPAPARKRTTPLLVIVPLPPLIFSRLRLPTSMASSELLLMETLFAVTLPPPVMFSVPLPLLPT